MENINQPKNTKFEIFSKEEKKETKKDHLIESIRENITSTEEEYLIDLKDKSIKHLDIYGNALPTKAFEKDKFKKWYHIKPEEYEKFNKEFDKNETNKLCNHLEELRSDESRADSFIKELKENYQEEEKKEVIVNKLSTYIFRHKKFVDGILRNEIPKWFIYLLDTHGPFFKGIASLMIEKELASKNTSDIDLLNIIFKNKDKLKNHLMHGYKHVTINEFEIIGKKFKGSAATELCGCIDAYREYENSVDNIKKSLKENEMSSINNIIDNQKFIIEAIFNNKIPSWFPKILNTDRIHLEAVKNKLMDLGFAKKDTLDIEILKILIENQNDLNNYVETLTKEDSNKKIKKKPPLISTENKKPIEEKVSEKQNIISKNIIIQPKERSIVPKKKIKHDISITDKEYNLIKSKYSKPETYLICDFIAACRQPKINPHEIISPNRPLHEDVYLEEISFENQYKDISSKQQIIDAIFNGTIPNWLIKALDTKSASFTYIKNIMIYQKSATLKSTDLEILIGALKNKDALTNYFSIREGFSDIFGKKDKSTICEWLDHHLQYQIEAKQLIEKIKTDQLSEINEEKFKPVIDTLNTAMKNQDVIIKVILSGKAPQWLAKVLNPKSLSFENLKKWMIQSKLANEKTLDVEILTLALEHEKEILPHIKKLLTTKGLSKIDKQIARDENKSGRIDPKEDKTAGDWMIVGEKKSGIEPGFVAKKKGWSEKHLDKVLHDEKYLSRALDWLKENTQGDKSEEDLKILLNEIVNDPINPLHDELMQAVRTNYIFKLNYADPVVDDLVQTDLERVNDTTFLHKLFFTQSITKKVHAGTTRDTIRNKNLGAVIECFSNDIYRALGLRSQDLYIVPSQYSNGKKKLMLAARYVSGKKGETFYTLEKSMDSGHLKNNEVMDPVTNKMVPVNPQSLAKLKLFMLLTGDHDKIGITGGNVGYVIEDGQAEIVNIDPGKSLESKPYFSQDDLVQSSGITGFFNSVLFPITGQTDKMTFLNIHDDFSYDNFTGSISNWAKGGYRNISICDDLSYKEQMKALREIHKNYHHIGEIYQQYLDTFGEETDDVNFSKELTEAFQRLSHRANQFFQIFQQRLELTDWQLDTIEGLEKLCSPTTSSWTDSKKQKVEFEHLQIVPGKRIAWNLEGDRYIFKATNSRQASTVLETVQEFLKKNGKMEIKLHREGDKVVISGLDKTSSELFLPKALKEYKNKY